MEKQRTNEGLSDVEKKILHDQEFMSKLKVAVTAKGPEHEDAEYSDGEFFTDSDLDAYRRKMLALEVKKSIRRRKKQVEREQQRLGGPIVLYTFNDLKKGKSIMAKKEEMKAKEAKEKEAKKVKEEKVKETKKEKKETKEKKDKGKKERKSRGPRVVDGKITLVEKTNPKREGSKAHKRYELYRKHKTVAAYLEAGGKRSSLRYDEKHGFIKLSGVKTSADKE